MWQSCHLPKLYSYNRKHTSSQIDVSISTDSFGRSNSYNLPTGCLSEAWAGLTAQDLSSAVIYNTCVLQSARCRSVGVIVKNKKRKSSLLLRSCCNLKSTMMHTIYILVESLWRSGQTWKCICCSDQMSYWNRNINLCK